MKNTSLVLAVLLVLGGLSACGGGGGGGGGGDPPVPTPSVSLVFTSAASGVAAPTSIGHAGDGSGRLFVTEQGGRVRVLRDGVLLPVAFLDIADRVLAGGERGLLGLAFPPGFAQKGYFYVNYTRAGDGATVVSRFFLSADPDLALPGSEQILLSVPQPFSNHNGGQLAFGPDGFLYIGLGDGGSGGDPLGNGQNLGELLGKLLRLDVESGAAPYGIPAGNPFALDPAARDEIWASGLRNPWRFSFDRLTGDLFVADVGQERWEEINFQEVASPGGANFGWNVLEGPDCFSPAAGCVAPARNVAPVAAYGHDLGCSVTGGYVYRGPGNPDLQGIYLYGDFCSGRIWGLRPVGGGWANQLLVDSAFSISAFGEDEAGRVYLADYAAGEIFRIDQQ
ncbi:PQQ-dependent sugar dehydrogenase [Desulfuromonas versatilis]|uniref:PQQ-dependent sugar dehydrogenase n=1 Tax=Desulfuromonas versatilis TaxID=2802975 RepID=UPI001C856654|nr:PQQ-dependent sugar dehydrogenase [Desulfuromonas versatilis]